MSWDSQGNPFWELPQTWSACCMSMFWFVVVVCLVSAFVPNELGARRKREKTHYPATQNQNPQKISIKDCTVLEGIDTSVLRIRAVLALLSHDRYQPNIISPCSVITNKVNAQIILQSMVWCFFCVVQDFSWRNHSLSYILTSNRC